MDLDTSDLISIHYPIAADHLQFNSQDIAMTDPDPGQQTIHTISSSDTKWHSSSISDSTECMDFIVTEDRFRNGNCQFEHVIGKHLGLNDGVGDGSNDLLSLSDDGVPEISNSDLSVPEVCISTNTVNDDEDLSYECQQAYRIFNCFLLDKHKGITAPFLHPIGHRETHQSIGGVRGLGRGLGQGKLRQSMCLRRMEEKFANREYETITEFVADFRLMLENCYRHHGVDHWVSKQAQKLEIMLEQKLTLLSRMLRERTALAVTSKGRFGAEEERGSGGTSTRRRSAPRSLATITVGGHESVMVQALRLEEQQRAKEERRQRELDKKEAEETSAKEVEEWERSLLAQASPYTISTLWELPAIGHFLCLAQTALNLPEIIFFELERCLLMPRCSVFLSKIMSSLLCPPQRRPTLNRRPALPYRRWESELRQKVQGWYRAVGSAKDQAVRAGLLGLSYQFFQILGEVSPLEETPFHLLSVYQRVWLVKALCDNVYETQKDVQDVVLGQPIHECRESVLGYDGKDNAYIHFPHFCGADLRIYCQSPSTPPRFPLPAVWVRRVELAEGERKEAEDAKREEEERACDAASAGTEGSSSTSSSTSSSKEDEEEEDEKQLPRVFGGRIVGNGAWLLKGEEKEEDSESSDEEDRKPNHNLLNTRTPSTRSRLNRDLTRGRVIVKVESEEESKPSRVSLKGGRGSPLVSGQHRRVKAEVPEPCLSVGEHSYMGRSPARSSNDSLSTHARSTDICVKLEGKMSGGLSGLCSECSRPDAECSRTKSEDHNCSCGGSPKPESQQPVSDYPCKSNLTAERMEEDQIQTKKTKRKKEPGREPCLGGIEEQRPLQGSGARTRQSHANAAKSSLQKEATAAAAATTKRDKHKMEEKDSHKTSPKKTKLEEPVEATFKLVCTSLEELRELISKTEDELDELESTKKRAARVGLSSCQQQTSWFQKRESVKELHITLIRLLNELSPWEPKLIKAFHRNRLRLKRDFDNFRKHPEYDNFVREECVSSSEDEEDMSAGSFTCSDPGRLTEEEDPLEHSVPRGLWTGDASRQLMTESAGNSLLTRRSLSPNPLKRLSSSTDEDLSPHKRLCTASGNATATSESLQQHRSKMDRPDSEQPPSEGSAQVPSRPVILHPTIGLPKGYTPIPTLLAKSVGNKVTLMKRPADHPSLNKQTHGQARVVSMPTATLAKPPHAPNPLSPQAIPVPRQQRPTPQQHPPKQSVPVCRHLASATITTTTTTACNPSSQQTAAAPKTPVQLVYKMAEGLGHLLRKESSSSSPMKISVQPVVDQKTGEKTFQQVVLLPHNLLVPEKTPALPQQQHHQTLQQQQQLLLPQHPKTIEAPASKIPTAFSTSVSGFTIPDGKIPIQQVAPLKDTRTVRTPSPAASPRLQGPTAAASPGFRVVPLPSSPRASTPLSKTPSPGRSPISSPPASTASSDTGKSSETRQELKTVCIRDSQSILVTTRGGNTGVVKVQTSTDPNSPGLLPTSPVISICPQFKAFLVSKSSLCPSAPLPPQSVSSSIPAAATSSAAQLQPQPATVPTASPASQAAGSNVPFSLNHGYNITTGAKTGQASPTVIASTPVSVPPRSNVPVPAARSVPHANMLQCINKPALKQAGVPDERSLFTKFILVSPPSSSPSNSVPKAVASSPDTALLGSRVMFVSQSAPAFSKTPAGSAPNQPAASATNGQSARLPAEALSKLQSLTLPSGVQIRLPGCSTNTLGQTACSLPQSPSVSTPGSGPRPGQAAATSSGLVFVRNPSMVTTTTTTSSSPAGAGETFSPSPPTAVTQPSLIRNPLAPVTATHHGLVKASTSSPVSAPQSHHSLVRVATTLAQPSAAPPAPATKIPHAQPSSPMKPPGASGNAAHPVTSASTGTVQQRIVINTSAPLAAGTQIVLNGTRFVVPPQGLGPGSHVLIISSPAPPPTTSTTTTITTAGAPPRGPSLATATPPSPAVPWASPVRFPGTPALRPARLTVGPPGVISAPQGSPLHTGASSLLSAFPTVRLPGVSAPLVSPALGPPRLAGPVSPILTRTPALGTIVPSTKLPLTPCLAPHLLCRSSIAPGPPAPAMLRLPVSTPVQCSPVVPSTPVAALPTPAIPLLAPLPPLLAQPTYVLTSPPPALGPTLPSQPSPGTATPRPPGTQLHKAALRLSAPSVLQDTVTSTGLTNAAVTAQPAPAVQTASPRAAQMLPMAIPSMGSRVFRMQSLPVATVPPSHIIKTSAQPIGKVTTSETISQPVLFSTAAQAAAKTPLQSSAQLIHTNLTSSKPLVSPDGASLNTVQGLVHPAGLPVISTKHLATLVVSPSSTAGRALPITVPSTTTHTDSPRLQSAQPDSSEPINPASS